MSTIQGSFVDGALSNTDDAAHSATLGLSEGDWSLEIPTKGREVVEGQTRGAFTGLRLGKRVAATMSVSAKVSDPTDAYSRLVEGSTSGFTSTTADIGDVPTTDWSFSFNLGAESRRFYGQDAHLVNKSIKEGDVTTVSYTFSIYGPIYEVGATGGTVTLVAAR